MAAAPPIRTAAWAALSVALVAVGLATRGGLLGFDGAEIYGHAWVQWWHARALPAWPDGPDGLLPGIPVWPVIDWLPTALGATLGRLGGLQFGWNVTWMLAFGAAAAGGAAVARRAGGDPAVGAVALALAPALQGAAASGLTEDAFVGVAALALALVGHRDWRWAALGGALLGLTAWFGLVLAWCAGLCALALGAAILVRDRRRWRALLLGAAMAALTVSPVAIAHATRLTGRGHRMGSVALRHEPLWQLNPWHGADLLSLVTPGRVDVGHALIRMHPGYLGLTLLALAVWGGRSRWWAPLWLMVALAPGLHVAAAGHPLGIDNPLVGLVQLFPLGDLLNHHARALLLAAVALAALASRGAARLPPRLRALAPLVVLLDLTLASPIGLPLPTTVATTLQVNHCVPATTVDEARVNQPPRCLADLPAGLTLHLPLAGPGVPFQRALLHQVAHGRPILLNPNQPGLPPAFAATPTGRWLSGLAFSPAPPPPHQVVLPPELRLIVAEAPYIDAVAAGLGPPDVRAADSAAWAVPAANN